ncbi:DMT family transporter [Rhodalgimonas zhirmunskyi]|uniref:Multidrug efflux SMR transporter n=1 Tax=Rhodalgimonas zhirmunskyi TaxID=2964767 RepID=A0AAJ1U408_9RHOB|nr:multidrug efflux SMR transporter [Rhodoalgimonas zhirmunskyi]MDQ2092810.1 multidrug efflux SMR transporter [Rhodoalgimonas zhirmunskyi]
MPYVFLALSILTETIGTTALQMSQQFTKLGPSIVVLVSYGISIFFMSLALKYMPVGLVYAIWSGLGIVLIATIGWFMFGQTLDAAAVLGIVLIIAGLLVIQLFSKTSVH